MGLDIPKLEQRCPGVSGMFTQSMPTYGKSTTAHGGQLYESIAVDPCPSMVLFFVLVFSGEDHLRVLFHWLLLLDLDGMTVHAKTVGCSLREAQTEFDTELGVLHLFEQAAGRNHALPTRAGAVPLSLLGVSHSFELVKEWIHTYGWPA